MYDRLTQSDIDKMKAEIEDRKMNQRPALIQAVKEARAQGDLSENFEYHAARKEKSQNESRITYLENMIKTATIVEDASAADADVVGLEKSVELYYPEDNETQKIKIVTTIRVNSLKGLISIESPLGKALLGHRKGDTIHVTVNEKVGYDVEIKDVSLKMDDSGDEIASF